MLPIPANIKLVVLAVIVGVIGVLQALAPIELTWKWIGGVVQFLSVAEAFFTLNKKPPSSGAAGAALLFMCVGLSTLTACPQAVPAVGPAASCVASVIADAFAGLDIPQILAKEGQACVKDAEDVITILFGQQGQAIRSTLAYKQALSARGQK